MKEELEPIAEYYKDTQYEGKTLKIKLSVYDDAILKSPAIKIYSKFTIMDSDEEWGHGMLSTSLSSEEAHKFIDAVAKEPQKYKNA